jgi:hypothetical protein
LPIFEEKKLSDLTVYSELLTSLGPKMIVSLEMAKNKEKRILSFELRIFPQFKSY